MHVKIKGIQVQKFRFQVSGAGNQIIKVLRDSGIEEFNSGDFNLEIHQISDFLNSQFLILRIFQSRTLDPKFYKFVIIIV